MEPRLHTLRRFFAPCSLQNTPSPLKTSLKSLADPNFRLCLNRLWISFHEWHANITQTVVYPVLAALVSYNQSLGANLQKQLIKCFQYGLVVSKCNQVGQNRTNVKYTHNMKFRCVSWHWPLAFMRCRPQCAILFQRFCLKFTVVDHIMKLF